MKMTKLRTQIILLLLAGFPALIHAQHTEGLEDSFKNAAGGSITNIIVERYSSRHRGEKTGIKQPGARPAFSINDAAVRFRSTGTQLKTREIADLISPGDAQTYAVLTAILTEFNKQARKIGKPDDLALALSFFFITNASVYHDSGLPSDAKMMELRDAIASVLIESNALNGVTDRTKQEMYEALVLYTGLALAAYQEGKQSNNAQSVNAGRQLAGASLQAVAGVSPDKISFTDQGLAIDSQSGAVNGSPVAPAGQVDAAPLESSNVGAITYLDMIRQYDTNEIAADSNYKGRRVRVTGPFAKAEKVSESEIQYGKILVWFWHTGYNAHLGCFFDDSERASVAQLTDRQTMVLEGTMLGQISPGRLMMNHCVITGVGPRKD